MNIIKGGKVLVAHPGEGISLKAEEWESLRRGLNGNKSDVTILAMDGGTWLTFEGYLAVPEPTAPDTVISRPDLAGVPAVEATPKEWRCLCGAVNHSGSSVACGMSRETKQPGKAVE